VLRKLSSAGVNIRRPRAAAQAASDDRLGRPGRLANAAKALGV